MDEENQKKKIYRIEIIIIALDVSSIVWRHLAGIKQNRKEEQQKKCEFVDKWARARFSTVVCVHNRLRSRSYTHGHAFILCVSYHLRPLLMTLGIWFAFYRQHCLLVIKLVRIVGIHRFTEIAWVCLFTSYMLHGRLRLCSEPRTNYSLVRCTGGTHQNTFKYIWPAYTWCDVIRTLFNREIWIVSDHFNLFGQHSGSTHISVCAHTHTIYGLGNFGCLNGIIYIYIYIWVFEWLVVDFDFDLFLFHSFDVDSFLFLDAYSLLLYVLYL